jgi:hypothetical protein
MVTVITTVGFLPGGKPITVQKQRQAWAATHRRPDLSTHPAMSGRTEVVTTITIDAKYPLFVADDNNT